MKLRTKAKWTDEETSLERENRELAFRAAAESIVLLENKGILPIRAGRLALYGAGAGKTIKGGTGSGEVIERHAVTIREGLENRGFQITTSSWLDRYDSLWESERRQFIAEMRKKVRRFNTAMLAELMAADYRYPYGDAIRAADLSEKTDHCVYVLSRQSGEGSDRRREDYEISDAERAHLQVCADHYRHVILVINTGASFDVSFMEDFPAISAVIYAGQLGQEGGNALADILTGAVTPSGKLAVSWAKKYGDIPFAQEYSYMGRAQDHAVYREGIYVGYRYYDTFDVSPRYPFGYGLSYTEFTMECEKVCEDHKEICVSVRVKNIGSCAGKETVQLYVSCPAGKLEKEYQRLAAFGKTRVLLPGESQLLQLAFTAEKLASYDEETAETLMEQGEYILRVGNSSDNTEICAAICLDETAVLQKHANLCASVRKIQKLHRKKPYEHAENVPVIRLQASMFGTEILEYCPKEPALLPKVEKALDSIGADGAADFCAGVGLFGGEMAFTVPGSVGNTTSKYWKYGIPNVAFCDGPAGLRVQRRSTVNKKGQVKPIDGANSLYDYLPGFLRKFLFGNPDKETMIYQYVTGFPVSGALAQTWNLPLMEKVGEGVGKEMAEYGITFWLAPALNIVRNPLCGRNYEYYSEDPLLSGGMAAAITRGVQSISGCYVTVKHFAANNQEENRYYVSSDMDERTLREIYLRGFETAICEAKPKAVMTAYNKLNGVYCPANEELIGQILRREWKFDGVVMTDWFSTGEDRAQNAEAIANGVDLIMPGGKAVVKELRKAVKTGKLSEEHVRRAAANVLTLVLESREKGEDCI